MDSENGMLAIKLGGKGDMTATAVRWRYQRGIPQLPSPLLYKDALYMVNDAGGHRDDAEAGDRRADPAGPAEGAERHVTTPRRSRVTGRSTSPARSGKVIVLPPGGGLEAIAINDLQDNIYATPALVDGRIYLGR